LLDFRLDICTVSGDPDAGIAGVTAHLATGRLKVFSTCTEWLDQYRTYRRNKTKLLDGYEDWLRERFTRHRGNADVVR
jgi:hypothetical protein